MTTVFYDPERIAALYARTGDAARDLAAIGCTDAAADGATTLAAGVRTRLVVDLAPALRRLADSDAMLGFVLSGLAGTSGDELGRTLLELADEVRGDDDDEAVVALRTALDLAADDPIAMQTFFTGLGPDRLADLLLRLGDGDGDDEMDHQLELATALRDGLARTTRVTGLPEAFASGIVERMVAVNGQGRRNGALALSFLFDDTTFDTPFLVAATQAVVDAELAVSGKAPEEGFLLWFPTMGMSGPGSVLARSLDDRPDASDRSELYRGGDPMYALMESVARNGAAGRALFARPDVAEYLFADRNWVDDGFRSIADAAEAATTGPAVGPGADRSTVDVASTIASAFVNWAGSRGDVMLDGARYANADVTASVATILGAHMSGVKVSRAYEEDVTDLAGAVLDLPDDSFGADVAVALFERTSLDVMTDVAVDDTTGLATIRAALDIFQADSAARAVPHIDTFETRDAFVAEAMTEAAALEAYFIEHGGHRAEAHGRDADEAVALWVDLAELGVDKAASATGPFAPIITTPLGPITDGITEALATHERAARADAEAYADEAARHLTYTWYRALYDGGVVTPPVLVDLGVAVNGAMIGWTAFNELDAATRIRARAAMENFTAADGFNLDTSAVVDRIRTEQLDLYRELL